MITICTFNVHYLIEPDKIRKCIIDNKIDVCGMQEVPGQKLLDNMLNHPSSKTYKGVFDNTYKTYGNGLVYCTTKFVLVESKNHIIGSTGGKNKKSAFRVLLKHIESGNIITIYVTHLDHVLEKNRIEQWKTFNLVCEANGDYKKKHIVLGDLNALTQTDYTLKRNMEIAAQRRAAKLEDPTSQLMDLITNQGYHDVAQYSACTTPTSRFNTRIDYILLSHYCDVTHVTRVQVIDTKDASDHLPVVCEINVQCF